MRKLFTLSILILSFLSGNAQVPQPEGVPTRLGNPWYSTPFFSFDKGLVIQPTDTVSVAKYIGTIRQAYGTYWRWTGSQWVKFGESESIVPPTETITGKPFTTLPTLGFNPGPGELSWQEFLQKTFYGLQPPIATLTPNTTLELTGNSSTSTVISWTAGRGLNTPPLTSVVVAGVTKTFTQPNYSSSVGGDQVVNVPANTTTVYQNIVTDSSGAKDTASVTINWLGKKYYGAVSDTTGIGSGTQDGVIRALSNAFASSRGLSTSINPSGTQFFVYAYPATLGNLSALTFNGFASLAAMNTATRSFTNSLGYTQTYILYWNKLGQTSSSTIIAQ